MSEQSQDLISSNIKQANLDTLADMILELDKGGLPPLEHIVKWREIVELARGVRQ